MSDARRARQLWQRTHTCEGDPLRVRLHRDGARWRVTRNGQLFGWVGLTTPTKPFLRIKGTSRFWVAYAPDGERVNMNLCASSTRRAAVEFLVVLAYPAHRRRRSWRTALLIGPPHARRTWHNP